MMLVCKMVGSCGTIVMLVCKTVGSCCVQDSWIMCTIVIQVMPVSCGSVLHSCARWSDHVQDAVCKTDHVVQ